MYDHDTHCSVFKDALKEHPVYKIQTLYKKTGIQIFLNNRHICDTFYGSTLLGGQDLLVSEVWRSHSDTSDSVGSSGRVISPSQETLSDDSQHSQKRDTYAP
jgi:hypothetical protein